MFASELREHVKTHAKDRYNGVDDVEFWRRVQTMVGRAVMAVETRLGRMQRGTTYGDTTYEILGYDIVLDDQLEPYVQTPVVGDV